MPLKQQLIQKYEQVFITFFTILFSLTVNAQDGCVEISPLIVSTSNSDILEAHPATGEIHRYFDLCAGETLSLQASPELSENTSFEWLLDGVIESNNNEFEETFNEFWWSYFNNNYNRGRM